MSTFAIRLGHFEETPEKTLRHAFTHLSKLINNLETYVVLISIARETLIVTRLRIRLLCNFC